MLTFTSRRNLWGDLAGTTATTTLATADILMNTTEKKILTIKNWSFLERQYQLTTAASTQDYKLHAYTRVPESVYVTVSSRKFVPREVTTSREWDVLTQTTVTSDSVTHYRVYDGILSLYPRPATAGNTITINGRRIARDLSVSDYTTGTITTTATVAGVTTVTATGATWHTGMIGRWIRITDSGVSANTLVGDHIWYEIATVPSSTTLTLVRAYSGTTLAAASANYIIGQVSLLPEPFDVLPVYDALIPYFTSIDPNKVKKESYQGLYNDLWNQMNKDFGSQESVVLDSGIESDYNPINPNTHVTL